MADLKAPWSWSKHPSCCISVREGSFCHLCTSPYSVLKNLNEGENSVKTQTELKAKFKDSVNGKPSLPGWSEVGPQSYTLPSP